MVVRGPGVEDDQDHQAQRKDQITSPGPGRLLPPRLGLVRSRSWRPGTVHDAHSTLAVSTVAHGHVTELLTWGRAGQGMGR
jgi:hypothetical protein